MTNRQYFDRYATQILGQVMTYVPRNLLNAIAAVMQATGVTLTDFRTFEPQHAADTIAAAKGGIDNAEVFMNDVKRKWSNV